MPNYNLAFNPLALLRGVAMGRLISLARVLWFKHGETLNVKRLAVVQAVLLKSASV